MIDASKIARVLKRSLRPQGVYHAQWLLTRRCNYRCRGCSVWADQEDAELSTEQVKHGLEILRDLGVVEIVFSGGNPLLRDDMGEIIDFASRNFITTVYDNGSLAAQRIDDLRKADMVAISIDSLDEKKNDYLKGVSGAWRRAMDTLETLKREGIPVGVSPTISQQNLAEIVSFTRYFSNRGIPVWYCFYWYDEPHEKAMFSIGKESDEYEIRDRKMLADVCTALLEMKKESSNIYITRKVLESLRHFALTGERTWRCRALSNFLVIDHMGRVAGCHIKEPLTSISELARVWNSQRFNKLRKEYRECENCAYLCYIFYSIHTGVSGNIDVLKDQWQNARLYMREAKKPSQTPHLAR